MADTQTLLKPKTPDAKPTNAPSGALSQALGQYNAAQGQAAASFNTPEQQAAESGFAKAVDQAEGAAKKTAAASQDYATQLGQMKAPEAPKAPDLPNAPTMAATDPMRVFGQFMPVMAMLGGALIKGHAIGALQAAVSAGKAAKENDAAALEAAHKQWQDRVNQVLQEYQLQRSGYDDALKTLETNKDLGMAKVQALAAASNDFRTLADLAGGRLDRIYQKRQAIDSAAQQIEQVKNHIDDMNVRQQELGLEKERIGMEAQRLKVEQQWKERDFALKAAALENKGYTASQKDAVANLTKNQQYKDAVKSYSAYQEKAPAIARVINKLNTDQPLSAADVQALVDAHTVIASGGAYAKIGQVKMIEHAMPLVDKLAAQAHQNPGGQVTLSKDQARAIADSYGALTDALKGHYEQVMSRSRFELAKKGIDPSDATPTGYDPVSWPTRGEVQQLKALHDSGDPSYMSQALQFKAFFGDNALTKFGISDSDDVLQAQRMQALENAGVYGGGF